MTTPQYPCAEELIRAAAKMLMSAVLQTIQADPHQWSDRPCATCRAVSGLAGQKFGCELYAQQRRKP
jgi:hypothetical protein